MKKGEWEPEDEAKLQKLYKEGYTYRTMGAMLKRNEISIRNKLYLMGLSGGRQPNPWSSAEVWEAYWLYHNKPMISYREIGEILGRSKYSVASKFNKDCLITIQPKTPMPVGFEEKMRKKHG